MSRSGFGGWRNAESSLLLAHNLALLVCVSIVLALRSKNSGVIVGELLDLRRI
jgi:hypothetical protein